MSRRPSIPPALAKLLGLTATSAFILNCTAHYGIDVTVEDNDDDGWPSPFEDCDDTDPEINPQAADPEGDGLDQNCDGIDGTNPTFPLQEITEEGWRTICEDRAVATPGEVFECNGVEITMPPSTAEENAERCVTGSNVAWSGRDECTFGVWVTCGEWEPDPCTGSMAGAPPECDVLLECAGGE